MTASTLDLATLPTPASYYLDHGVITVSDEPEDGAVVIVSMRGGWQNIDIERVFVRTDEEPGQASGSWWPIGDPADPAKAKRPLAWGEVLAFDEPRCDRPSVSWERLYSASELALLAGAR